MRSTKPKRKNIQDPIAKTRVQQGYLAILLNHEHNLRE